MGPCWALGSSLCVHAKSLQSCPTLCNPVVCSPPGSSVHGILQARILEQVALPSSRGSFWPRDQTCISYVSCIGRCVLYHALHQPVLKSLVYLSSDLFEYRNDAKAEIPVLWPPHAKTWLIGKDSDAGRDWGQEKKGTTEDEMAGWHHWLDGRESQWTPGVGDGQGGLACCNSWGRKELDRTERLIWSLIIFWACSLCQVLFWVLECDSEPRRQSLALNK